MGVQTDGWRLLVLNFCYIYLYFFSQQHFSCKLAVSFICGENLNVPCENNYHTKSCIIDACKLSNRNVHKYINRIPMKTIGWDWIETLFNNIPVMIWWSVFLNGENHRLVRRQRKHVTHRVVLNQLNIIFSSLLRYNK